MKDPAWQTCLVSGASFLTGALAAGVIFSLKKDKAYDNQYVVEIEDDCSMDIPPFEIEGDSVVETPICSTSHSSIVTNVASVSFPPVPLTGWEQSLNGAGNGTAGSSSSQTELCPTMHTPGDGLVYICRKCIPSFKSLKAFHQHMEMKHSDEGNDPSPTLLKPRKRRGRPRGHPPKD